MTVAATPRPGWRLPRQAGDVVRVGLAVVALVVSAYFVHRHRVGVLETDVFRVVNDLPSWLLPVFWPVMQLGNLFAVPAAAAVVAALRRYRLAAEVAVAGLGVWLLAKVVKGLVVRGRPATLLPDVHIHGAAAGGRGYLSGHAAVSAAIATLVLPYVGRRARRALILVVVLVAVARVYVGAHLPLDVVGGAALGWGAASAVHLLLGTPSGRPSPRRVRRTLESYGFAVASLEPADRDPLRASRFLARTAGGQRLFVKVFPREVRERDLVYRAWTALRRRSTPRSRRAPAEQAEREAVFAVAARAAGVAVPTVVAAGRFSGGSGWLVQEWVDGRPLDAADADPRLALALWRDLDRLHRAGIALGDLGRYGVLVDAGRTRWFVDLADAVVAPLGADGEAVRAADVAALLVLLGDATDPVTAVRAGVEVVGAERVRVALGLPRGCVPPAARERLNGRADLWPGLVAAAVARPQSAQPAVP